VKNHHQAGMCLISEDNRQWDMSNTVLIVDKTRVLMF